MAKRKTKTKRPAKKRTAKKRPTALPPSGPPMLDLRGEPDRPTIRLPVGDYKMRLAEELTFDQFAVQMRAGKAMIEMASDLDQDDVLQQMQALVVESATVLLVDLDAEAAATITPGMYMKISTFFNELGSVIAELPSESGTSSAPGVSDSTEAQVAA